MNTRVLRYLAVSLSAVIIFLVGFIGGQMRPLIYDTHTLRASNQFNSSLSRIEDPELLSEIYSYLTNGYLKQELPAEKELVDAAAKGMLKALDDRYTNYYTPAEWADLQTESSGQYKGIGIKITSYGNYPQIETLFKESPAAQSGLLPLDLIVSVDDKNVENMSIAEVADLIRGPIDSEVALNIYREADQKSYDFKVKRQEIDVDSVSYSKDAKGIVHIELAKFTESDISEFYKQWDSAVKFVQDNPDVRVVLDLRNNTGGWVAAAKYVLEDFLAQNTVILKEVDRDGNIEELKTTRDGRLKDTKVVVLVNKGSASASEIVAGALQDLGRAELVGVSTTGKGVEQQVLDLSNGGKLFLVFRYWQTPNGRNLSNDNALTPDHEVDLTTQDVQNKKDPQLEKAKELL